MIGAGLLPLVIAGCSSSGSETAPVTGSEELLQDHGFADIDAREIIDRLEALPVAERPQNLIASVTPSSVQLQDDAGREAELPLPEGQFYLSVAPFVETTHECAFHSLTTCRGELRSREVTVSVVDAGSGEILEEGTRTTHDNGFFGLWLPRGITAELTCALEEYTGSASISTQAEDDLTCLTSLQLT
ncbi:MAG TPA: CueP family metal-binding protein [Candidatus Brachybacterium merdavium]|uniref:CueP family metal-binding protein n=1 Tax=Candidatus Brachybacterium merdavium TaxID=2838513 RepID=A0A9D2LCA1_9MICO|nr:CueP family metal-binding protein [Candidatus Brachybacterium merdavium]